MQKPAVKNSMIVLAKLQIRSWLRGNQHELVFTGLGDPLAQLMWFMTGGATL